MWGNVLRSALVCGVLTAGVPAGAAAMADVDPYTPVTPRESTLAGSVVSSMCRTGDPVIVYSLVLTEGSGPGATARSAPFDGEAVLTLTDGASTTELVLGTIREGRLAGEIAWPAATSDTVPPSTGGAVRADLRVGETVLAVPLERPSSEGCAAPLVGSATLAVTGAELPVIAGAIGAVALTGGLVAVVVGRRRARRVTAGR